MAPENHEPLLPGNPKPQETGDQIPLSCGIHYFVRAASPLPTPLSEFFTGDFLVRGQSGMALIIALATNLFAYWNADRVVLRGWRRAHL